MRNPLEGRTTTSQRLEQLPDRVREKLERASFLLLDVDGVLTDGRLWFDADGREAKVFHVHDGSALVYWKRCGFRSGLLSGRDSIAVRKRAEELGVDEVLLGNGHKLGVFEKLVDKHGLDPADVIYVGDDLLDLPVLHAVGIPMTVPSGRDEVRRECCYVTETPAGWGAVREIVELTLEAKGLFQRIVESDGRPFADTDEAQGGL